MSAGSISSYAYEIGGYASVDNMNASTPFPKGTNLSNIISTGEKSYFFINFLSSNAAQQCKSSTSCCPLNATFSFDVYLPDTNVDFTVERYDTAWNPSTLTWNNQNFTNQPNIFVPTTTSKSILVLYREFDLMLPFDWFQTTSTQGLLSSFSLRTSVQGTDGNDISYYIHDDFVGSPSFTIFVQTCGTNSFCQADGLGLTGTCTCSSGYSGDGITCTQNASPSASPSPGSVITNPSPSSSPLSPNLSPSPSSSKQGSSSPGGSSGSGVPVVAVAAGVAGGIVLLILIVAAVLFYRRKQNGRSSSYSFSEKPASSPKSKNYGFNGSDHFLNESSSVISSSSLASPVIPTSAPPPPSSPTPVALAVTAKDQSPRPQAPLIPKSAAPKLISSSTSPSDNSDDNTSTSSLAMSTSTNHSFGPRPMKAPKDDSVTIQLNNFALFTHHQEFQYKHSYLTDYDGVKAKPVVSTMSRNMGNKVLNQEQTLINTHLEVSLPGFLCMNYANQLRLLEPISKGAAGILWRAQLLDSSVVSRAQSEYVAVKEFVTPEKSKIDEKSEHELFHQEVSVMWSLSFHPNVVTLIGYTEQPRAIITKLYDMDLTRLLDDKTNELQLADVLSLAKQIVAGMEAIHDMGIVHKDLKSRNILVYRPLKRNPNIKIGPSGWCAVICDFGIARVSQKQIVSQNLHHVIGFSPRYAAPEVFARSYVPNLVPDPEEEKKADVYAFAIVLYELLTRETPWKGYKNEQIETAVRSERRPNLSSIKIPTPAKDPIRYMLVELIKACWRQDPHSRPSFKDVNQKLREFDL